MISAPPSDDDRKNLTAPATESGSLDADSVDLSFEQELEDLFAEDLGLSDDPEAGAAGGQASMADDLLAELAGDGLDSGLADASDAVDASEDQVAPEDEDAAEIVLGEGVSIDDDEGALELTDLAPAEATEDLDVLELAPDAVLDAEDAPGETEAVIVATEEDEDGEVMLLDELLEAGDEVDDEDEIVELAEALPEEGAEESTEEVAVAVPEPDAETVEAVTDDEPQFEQPELEPVELEPTDFEDMLEEDDGPALAESESLLSPDELRNEFTEELEEQLEPVFEDDAAEPTTDAALDAQAEAPADRPHDMPPTIPEAAADALAENLDAPEDLDEFDDLGDLESFDMNIPEEPGKSAPVTESEEIDLDGLDGLLDEMGRPGEAKGTPEKSSEEGADDIGELADIEALLEETEAELAGEDESDDVELDDLAQLGVDDLDALLEGVRDDDLEVAAEVPEMIPVVEEPEESAAEAEPDAAPQMAEAAEAEDDLLRDDLLDDENLFMGGDLTAFDGVELPDIDVSEFDADLPGEGRDEVARLLDDINPEEFADTPGAGTEAAEQPLAGAPVGDMEFPAAAPGSCEDFKARLMELERRGAEMDAVLNRLSLLEDKVQAMDEALDAARSGLRSLEDRSVDLESALEGFDERFKDEIEQAVPLEAARIIREEIAALARELDG